jgi:hypothetical protein
MIWVHLFHLLHKNSNQGRKLLKNKQKKMFVY